MCSFNVQLYLNKMLEKFLFLLIFLTTYAD